MRYLLFLALSLTTSLAQAEYRVFLLRIRKGPPAGAVPPAAPTGAPAPAPEERLVLSTLDPIQYPLYYPLEPGETVSYTETWRCYGRTDNFKDYCPNPKRAPAANGTADPTVATVPAPNQGPAPSAKP